MANIKSAIKRARQNEKLRKHNASGRSKLRTYVKKVLKAVASGDSSAANEAYLSAQPVIDKAVNKGIIHRNTAARIKSRLVAHVKSIAA